MKSSNSWQDNHSQGACNTLDLLQAVQKDKMRRRRQEREREREREREGERDSIGNNFHHEGSWARQAT